MSKQSDPRIIELQDLAREEGIVLPMPVDLIVYFERHGRIVDLCSGVVYANITAVSCTLITTAHRHNAGGPFALVAASTPTNYQKCVIIKQKCGHKSRVNG